MNSFSFVSDGWQIKKESRTIPLKQRVILIENLLNQWKKNNEVLLQPFTVSPKKNQLLISPYSNTADSFINPLTPMNDQDIISPYYIYTISCWQVMRLKGKYQLLWDY